MGKNDTKGTIFDIIRYAIHDGPGIRTTVFLKGCPLRCWWCHNPEGISSSKEIIYFEYKCIDCRTCINVCPANAIAFDGNKQVITRTNCTRCGACTEACPTGALRIVGQEISVEELMQKIEKDVLLHDSSGGGITFSGGEPLYQPSFLIEASKECKRKRIHTVLDTSGYASPKVFESLAKYVDLFLYDIKLLDDKEHQKYTGVSNNAIKKNLMTLAKKSRGRDAIIRFPIIPRITDTEKNVNEIVNFVSRLKGIKEIDILPFHDVSEKYSRLGKKNEMKIHKAPTEEKLKYIKEKLEGIGLYVKVGG